MNERRRQVIATTGAVLGGTAGCLGFGGGGSGGPDVRVRNRTDGERTMTVEVRRPATWTPAGTATRTEIGAKTVGSQKVTVSPDGKQTVSDILPSQGEIAVHGILATKNEPEVIRGASRDFARGNAGDAVTPIDIDIYYVEDSPSFDGPVELLEKKTYFHVVVSDVSPGPE